MQAVVAYPTPVPATVQNTHVETTAVKSQMLQNGRVGSAATVPGMAHLQLAFWVPSRKNPSQQTRFCVFQLGACSSSVAYTLVPATVQNTHVETTAVKSQMLQNGRGGSATAVPVMARLQFAFWVPSRNNPIPVDHAA